MILPSPISQACAPADKIPSGPTLPRVFESSARNNQTEFSTTRSCQCHGAACSAEFGDSSPRLNIRVRGDLTTQDLRVHTHIMKPSSCHCIKLRRAAQHLSSLYDAALASTGLKVTQFGLLHMIKSLDGPNLSKLSEVMGLDRSTLGRNVRVLERMRLVSICGGQDERETVVHVTQHGVEKLSDAEQRWRDCQRKVDQALGGNAHQRLAALLRDVTKIEP